MILSLILLIVSGLMVTGGAGGMGSQICRTFAAQGAKVVVADTGADVEGRMGADPSRVNGVVEAITRSGGEAVGSVGDVATMDYAESLIRLALDTLALLAVLGALAGGLRLDLALDPCAADIDARPVTCPQ